MCLITCLNLAANEVANPKNHTAQHPASHRLSREAAAYNAQQITHPWQLHIAELPVLPINCTDIRPQLQLIRLHEMVTVLVTVAHERILQPPHLHELRAEDVQALPCRHHSPSLVVLTALME